MQLVIPEYNLQIMQIVKALRIQKGIKQIVIANALNIDRSNYGRMEQGKKNFTPGHLATIANILEVSVYYIYLASDIAISRRASGLPESDFTFLFQSMKDCGISNYSLSSKGMDFLLATE